MTNKVKGSLVQFVGAILSAVLWTALMWITVGAMGLNGPLGFFISSLAATVFLLAAYFYGMNLAAPLSEVAFNASHKERS